MDRKIILENRGREHPACEIQEFERKPFEFGGKERPEWQHALHVVDGVECHTFKAAPGATFEGNKAPGDWIGIATQGSGLLLVTDEAGKVISEVPFSKGDVFEFRDKTMHGWRIGPEGAETVFLCKREADGGPAAGR
jgi:hypothetical protein